MFKPIGVLHTKQDMREFKKWIAALRSGEYKQVRSGDLQNSKGYCCLGVACKVLIPNTESLQKALSDYGYPDIEMGSPKWLHRIDYNIKGEFGFDRLSNLNDSYGASFDEIADLLEAVYIHRALE